MKLALVHDYIKEFGGAERVLRVLSDMYPEAPIYTAFVTPGSTAAKEFADRKLIESKWGGLLKYGNWHSPLRFLLPWVWGSLDLSDYDLVITSCSGYIARGFKVKKNTKVIAYCHTPPKNLYGLQTSINWMGHNWANFVPAKIYATVVNHYLRLFDFQSAQGVNKWIANSMTVKNRIAKFYRKEAEVIYPPVEVELFEKAAAEVRKDPTSHLRSRFELRGAGDYFLIVSRLVGSKGLVEAVKAAKHLGIKLKIVGGTEAVSGVANEIYKLAGDGVEVLGRISDDELFTVYAKARGFIALARNEDFGMTVVEAMAAGTPVIAFNGGGFRETVIDGETGILIDDTDVATLEKAFKRFDQIKWDKVKLQKQAQKFSREKFEEKINKVVAEYAGTA